jgi:hypothetical protein
VTHDLAGAGFCRRDAAKTIEGILAAQPLGVGPRDDQEGRGVVRTRGRKGVELGASSAISSGSVRKRSAIERRMSSSPECLGGLPNQHHPCGGLGISTIGCPLRRRWRRLGLSSSNIPIPADLKWRTSTVAVASPGGFHASSPSLSLTPRRSGSRSLSWSPARSALPGSRTKL